jgi:hypothetical protein
VEDYVRELISRRRGVAGFVTLVATSSLLPGLGCGTKGAAEVTPALASCVPGWQEIYGPRPYFPPPQILPHGDRIYFSELADNQLGTVINSVPSNGGAATTLVEDTGAFLWAEGDNLLFAPYGDHLQTVPLAGGTPATVQDGGYCANRPSQCRGLLLDEEFLYLSADARNIQDVQVGGVSLRRMSRATGAEDELAMVHGYPTSFTRLVGDSLMVATDHVYVVPRSGGPLLQLTDSEGILVGLDDGGALSYTLSGVDTTSVSRAPIDGGPLQPFWADKPPRFRAWSITPDGSGGWTAAGLEPFDDGASHVSIWSLDTHQAGVRLACDPRVSTGFVGNDEDVPGVVVGTPDAVYATVLHLPTLEWSLVRAAR